MHGVPPHIPRRWKPAAGSVTMSENFEEAYRRARQKAGDAEWRHLSNEDQEKAVLAEMRALETERCAGE